MQAQEEMWRQQLIHADRSCRKTDIQQHLPPERPFLPAGWGGEWSVAVGKGRAKGAVYSTKVESKGTADVAVFSTG